MSKLIPDTMQDMNEMKKNNKMPRRRVRMPRLIGERNIGTTHLKKLCEKYDRMAYFNRVRGD